MDLKSEHPKHHLTPEQAAQAKASFEYIKSLHAEEFMNVFFYIPLNSKELMTHLIYAQPENPKSYLVDLLKKSKKDDKGILRVNSEHLEKADYESMFDTYDILNMKVIPYTYLVQALQSAGVIDATSILKAKYPDIKENAMIGKKQFVSILSAEHRHNGFGILTMK